MFCVKCFMIIKLTRLHFPYLALQELTFNASTNNPFFVKGKNVCTCYIHSSQSLARPAYKKELLKAKGKTTAELHVHKVYLF